MVKPGAATLTVSGGSDSIPGVKVLLGFALLAASSGCTTLENRRDLYSPDVELYPTRTTTTRVQTTTTRVREQAADPAFQEEAPELRPR